jgi:hypothetical protein
MVSTPDLFMFPSDLNERRADPRIRPCKLHERTSVAVTGRTAAAGVSAVIEFQQLDVLAIRSTLRTHVLRHILVGTEIAEDVLRDLEGPPGLALGGMLLGQIGRRNVVNEAAEHLVTEGRIVLRVEDEFMPCGIDGVGRAADARPRPAQEEELLHVEEQLFSAVVAQAELDLETFDEFGVLVCENLIDQGGVAAANLRLHLYVHCFTS